MDRSDLKKAVLETAAEMQQHPQMLAFSCGADSLASLIRMRAWGLDPKLVYFYFIPDLVLIETYLAYIERIFDTQIMRLPHKLWTQFMANGLLQKPGVGKRMYEHTDLGTPSSSLLNTWAVSTVKWGRFGNMEMIGNRSGYVGERFPETSMEASGPN